MKTIHTRMRRFLSASLVVLLLLGVLPMAVFAADPDTVSNFQALKKAVTSEKGQTIKLGDDISLEEPLVTSGKVVIDLNGKTIDAGYAASAVDKGKKDPKKPDYAAIFIVSSGSSLTLKGKGSVKPGSLKDLPDYAVYVMSGGSLTVSGSVKITGDDASAVLVHLARSASLSLTGNVQITGGSVGIETGSKKEYTITDGDASTRCRIQITPDKEIVIRSGSAMKMDEDNRIVFSEMISEDFQVTGDGVRVSDPNSTVPTENVKEYIFKPREPDPTPQAPGTPSNATWVNSSTQASWSAVDGAASYHLRLYLDGIQKGDPISVSDTSVDLQSKIKEYGDGAYSFDVQAVGSDGQKSGWSAKSGVYIRDTTAPGITSGRRPSRDSVSTATFYFTVTMETRPTKYAFVVTASAKETFTVEEIKEKCKELTPAKNGENAIHITGLKKAESKYYVHLVVEDEAGNTTPYKIEIPRYNAQETDSPATPTPTAKPTATPTPKPSTYTVTLNGGTGYTIAPAGGSSSPVQAGGSYSFTVSISNGYTKSSSFAVKANGVVLASYNGVYTISNIGQNQTVSVSGVVSSNSGGGTTVVAPIPSITTTVLPAATMGTPYNLQLTATGGTPITWSYTGNLPEGVTVSTGGLISGTPEAEGSFRFTLKASNSTGSANRQMTMVVTGEDYTVTEGANAEWTNGSEEGLTFASSGKGTAFTVRIDGSTVPEADLTFAADYSSVTVSPAYLGTLSGGSHTLTMVYADGNAKTKFTVKAQDNTVAPEITGQPQSTEVNEGDTVTFTVTASGTTPLLCQWQVDANDGAGWTDMAGATGAGYSIEGVTPDQNGWKFRCIVTNSAGSAESKAATLTVKGALGNVTGDENTDKDNGSGIGGIILPIVILVALCGVGGGLYYYVRRRKLVGEEEYDDEYEDESEDESEEK